MSHLCTRLSCRPLEVSAGCREAKGLSRDLLPTNSRMVGYACFCLPQTLHGRWDLGLGEGGVKVTGFIGVNLEKVLWSCFWAWVSFLGVRRKRRISSLVISVIFERFICGSTWKIEHKTKFSIKRTWAPWCLILVHAFPLIYNIA